MKITRILTAALPGLISLCVLQAQEEPPKLEPPKLPPPQFPLKLRAPENAAWTIFIESKAKAQEGSVEDKNASSKQQRVVTKTFPIYHEVGTQGAKSWEKWVIVGKSTYRFIKYTGDSTWRRLQDSAYSDISRYDKKDFEEAEWADKGNYQEVAMLDKRPVYFFSADSSTAITRSDESNTMASREVASQLHFMSRAWIDAQTLLPLKIEDSRETRTYVFGPAPSSRLSPPPEVIADLKKWVELTQQLSR